MPNPIEKRNSQLNEIKTKTFDLIVIGGGITGAGIILDAAAGGLSTLLVEKGDFASGTSSKSTKLIHGGLRYLKQGKFLQIRKNGRERAIVYNNAPHLVVPERVILPHLKDVGMAKFMIYLGLTAYDFLARNKGRDKVRMLSQTKLARKEPWLNHSKFDGGALYTEYRTDDARLTLEIIKTAIAKGATALNYIEAVDFIKIDGKISGAVITDQISGQEIRVRSSVVINAAGPWADKVRKIAGGKEIEKENENERGDNKLVLSKGVHLVVSNKCLPLNNSIYFQNQTDGRMIFMIPRLEVTYFGTTDTFYTGSIDEQSVEQDDIYYLIESVNEFFGKKKVKMSDIIASYSGLRPLLQQPGKAPGELSRRNELYVSEQGLISIMGGKLTGYRLMAKKAVDKACRQLGLVAECTTENIKINGGDFTNPNEVYSYIRDITRKLSKHGYAVFWSEYLVRNYGKQTTLIIEILDTISENDNYLKLLLAELRFCVAYEMVLTLEDFLTRRTGRAIFRNKGLERYIDTLDVELKSLLSDNRLM